MSSKPAQPPKPPPKPASSWSKPAPAGTSAVVAGDSWSDALGEFRMAYLLAYNFAQGAAWLAVAGILVWEAAMGTAAGDVFKGLTVVRYILLAAFLEVIHAVVGLAGGGVLPAFMQWVGRSMVYFGFALRDADAATSPFTLALLFVWALSEIIRYPFYMAAVINSTPRALLWLRYSAFIVLYPLGFLAEMVVIYVGWNAAKYDFGLPALPFVAPLTRLEIAILAYCFMAYVMLAPKLYRYMWRQRSIKLGGGKTKQKKEEKKQR